MTRHSLQACVGKSFSVSPSPMGIRGAGTARAGWRVVGYKANVVELKHEATETSVRFSDDYVDAVFSDPAYLVLRGVIVVSNGNAEMRPVGVADAPAAVGTLRKRLSRIGSSQGVLIERPILQLLGIHEDTTLEISTDGVGLYIRPVADAELSPVETKLAAKHVRPQIAAAAKVALEKYESAFRKLAK